MAQNDKNSACCAPYLGNHPSHDRDLCYTSVKWWCLHQYFLVFKVLIFRDFKGLKGQVVTQNCQFQSVTFHISGTLNHIIKILGTQVYLMISPGVSLHFLKKYNIVNIKNSHVFYWPTSTVLLINSCFSSSSINAKK